MDIKVGDKVKIRQYLGVPGFGGLNFTSLREDGWESGIVLTVEMIYAGRVMARWGPEYNQTRCFWPSEVEKVDECEDLVEAEKEMIRLGLEPR